MKRVAAPRPTDRPTLRIFGGDRADRQVATPAHEPATLTIKTPGRYALDLLTTAEWEALPMDDRATFEVVRTGMMGRARWLGLADGARKPAWM